MNCVNDLLGAQISRVIAVHDHRHFFLSNGYTLTFPSWVEISGDSTHYDDLEGRTIERLGNVEDRFEMGLSDGMLVTITLRPPVGSQSVQTLSLIDPNDNRLVWTNGVFVE